MKIGYVGLGNMGGNMALRLLDKGHELVVTDVNVEGGKRVVDAGATWADSPAEVAASVDIILSSLPGPPQVEAVALGSGGIIEGIRPGALYADMSTSSPLVIRKVGEAFAAKGATAIDAPVSGGPNNCREGSLVILVGASEQDYQRIEPVLDDLGKQVLHIGDVGAGAMAKILNNAVGLSTLALLSEVISLGVKAGLDHRSILNVLQQGAYGQGLFLTLMVPEVAFKHRYSPAGFALDLGRKDIALATSLARELNVPMPMINLVEQSAVEMVQRGHGRDDSTIIFSLQELRAGVTMHDDDVEPFAL